MLTWLGNVWRVPELRKRLLFTAGVLAVYRLGSWIPAPGVNQQALQSFFGAGGGGSGVLSRSGTVPVPRSVSSSCPAGCGLSPAGRAVSALASVLRLPAAC